MQCVRTIHRTRKVGCVVTKEYGMLAIRYSLNGQWKTPDKTQFLTFSEFQLFNDTLASVHAASSPIVYRLDRYMRLLFCHNIMSRWRPKTDYDKSETEKTVEIVAETGVTKSEFGLRMEMILSRGYLVAFTAFLGEIIVDFVYILYLRRKMKQSY